MTREEMKAKMAEYLATAEEGVKEYNDLLLEGKYDAKVEEKFNDAISDYTSMAQVIAFSECVESGDPMKEACIRLSFETIRAKNEPIEEGSKIKKKVIEPTEKRIDLKRLQKFCDGKLGVDSNWVYALEKLNFLLTAHRAKELGDDPKQIRDCYAMADISREYDLGKNPASNTNLLKTITGIVQQMIGEEFKPNSHDVKFLLFTYSKKGREALKVSCANHKQMRELAQEICHRILVDGKYAVDFKRIKK